MTTPQRMFRVGDFVALQIAPYEILGPINAVQMGYEGGGCWECGVRRSGVSYSIGDTDWYYEHDLIYLPPLVALAMQAVE